MYTWLMSLLESSENHVTRNTHPCPHPQDVLSQQQKNVSKVFLEKLQSSTAEDANSPTDIADIDSQFNFTETYPENF